MEGMRELLRGSLGKSLGSLQNEDKLAAAWTVICGTAMADRGYVDGYNDGVLRIRVVDATWKNQMLAMRSHLRAELTRIAGVPVSRLEFEVPGAEQKWNLKAK